MRVRATAVNRADLLQRMGGYRRRPTRPQDIPGLEYRRRGRRASARSSGWKVGDRVFGLVGGGGYAEHVVVHARTLARIPDGLSFTDAAAVPEAFITAYDAMVDARPASRAGETVLVHAVGSGVGTAAVQLARAIGARMHRHRAHRDKLERARALGLDEGIVPAGGDSPPRCAAAPAGATWCSSWSAARTSPRSSRCVARRGPHRARRPLAGARAELDLGRVLRKRLQLRGTVLRSRPLEEKIAAMQPSRATWSRSSPRARSRRWSIA